MLQCRCSSEPSNQYLANDGRFVVFVPERDGEHALELLHSQTFFCPVQHAPARVRAASSGIVTLRSRIGGNRALDILSGELLPNLLRLDRSTTGIGTTLLSTFSVAPIYDSRPAHSGHSRMLYLLLAIV